MEEVRFSIHPSLPAAWKPSVKFQRRLAKRLYRVNGCIVAYPGGGSAPRVNNTSSSALQQPRGVGKRGGQGYRAERVSFNKHKLLVRQLLYIWETGIVDEELVKPRCNQAWCVKPSHQTCGRLRKLQQEIDRKTNPWIVPESDTEDSKANIDE